MRFAFLCALVALVTAPVHAQYPVPVDSVAGPIAEPEPDEEANHAPNPNLIPYETETSVGERILAFPATLWSGVAYVFQSAVLYAEYSGTIERLQARYVGPEPPPYGFTPTLGFGGRDGLTVGGSVFHNNVFGTGRHARIGGRYGFEAPSTYSFYGRFRDPALFGSPLRFALDARYESDGDERVYERGNDTSEAERVEYARRQAEGDVGFIVPIFGPFSLDLSAEYKHIEISDGDLEARDDLVGFGTADWLSAGGDVVFDFSRAGGLVTPRTYAGSVFILGYRYGHDVGERDFAYHRVKAEWRQFVPLPVLAFDRRLAVRVRLEKTHPPEGAFVPFYELATLGGPDDLRGYANDRFRDEGYFLATVEYRYPVFDILDGVVFYDTGQVFQRYEDIDPAALHHDVGAGLRVYGRQGVAGRLEVAYSPEGVRILARVGTTF
jgi:outer membrane protein assembly factor BamA